MVRVGQVWRECDNRFVRDVIVLSVENGSVRVKTMASSTGTCGRTTRVSEGRFNGKHGGYALLEDI